MGRPTNHKNPVRNQVDYTVRNEQRLFVKDSRSYMGTTTHSDHRLVMAKMNINWHWKTPKKTNTKKINIERLNDRDQNKISTKCRK